MSGRLCLARDFETGKIRRVGVFIEGLIHTANALPPNLARARLRRLQPRSFALKRGIPTRPGIVRVAENIGRIRVWLGRLFAVSAFDLRDSDFKDTAMLLSHHHGWWTG
jgi:hypothetical protein